MGSRIIRLTMLLCAALVVTVVSSGARAQTKQDVDLLIAGEFVVTIDDTRPVIRNGAVAVKDGRIVAVGTAREIAAAYQAPLTLPGEQRVLMPGLVNGHTHAAMVLFRGLADDLALSEWLTNFTFRASPRPSARTPPTRWRPSIWWKPWPRRGSTTFGSAFTWPRP